MEFSERDRSKSKSPPPRPSPYVRLSLMDGCLGFAIVFGILVWAPDYWNASDRMSTAMMVLLLFAAPVAFSSFKRALICGICLSCMYTYDVLFLKDHPLFEYARTRPILSALVNVQPELFMTLWDAHPGAFVGVYELGEDVSNIFLTEYADLLTQPAVVCVLKEIRPLYGEWTPSSRINLVSKLFTVGEKLVSECGPIIEQERVVTEMRVLAKFDQVEQKLRNKLKASGVFSFLDHFDRNQLEQCMKRMNPDKTYKRPKILPDTYKDVAEDIRLLHRLFLQCVVFESDGTMRNKN